MRTLAVLIIASLVACNEPAPPAEEPDNNPTPAPRTDIPEAQPLPTPIPIPKDEATSFYIERITDQA